MRLSLQYHILQGHTVQLLSDFTGRSHSNTDRQTHTHIHARARAHAHKRERERERERERGGGGGERGLVQNWFFSRLYTV